MPIHDDRTIARFWKHVDIRGPDECWPWMAGKGGGYGRFRTSPPNSVTRCSHAIAYEIATGLPGKPCVCHSCDNPPCCNPAHLWAGTKPDNVADMVSKQRQARGERQHCAKLTKPQVEEIRVMLETGVLEAEIASRFSVSQASINDISCGRAWGWVGEKVRRPSLRAKGERHGMAKFSAEQVIEIRACLSGGATHRALAARFKVSKTAIGDINRRKVWGWLQ